MNYLGDTLRERRRALGLSQDAVACRVFGRTTSCYRQIEQGARPFPLARLEALADTLGETADWWRRVVSMHAALSRIPDDARMLHHVLELLTDLYVAGNLDPRLGHDLARFIEERMGR